MDFGQKLTKYRKEAGLTLREFAQQIGYDPSNISKVERGKLPPPPASIVLKKWAEALGLEPTSRETADFVSTGLTAHIRKRVRTDEEIEALMPAFFRAVDNKKVDPETYKKLKEILRKNV